MKIGIITLPLHTNYGGILQAFALQKVLKELGHEVLVIDWNYQVKLPASTRFLIYTKRAIQRYILGQDIEIFPDRFINKQEKLKRQHTNKFIEKHIKRHVIKDISEIKEDEFDCFVVGSDQIWRKLYNKRCPGWDNAFLGFAQGWNVKRIAYAASFGTEEWEYDEKETRICSTLANKFNAISVRELNAVNLCKERLGVHAIHLLDPTMLFKVEDYMQLVSETEIESHPGILHCYILDNNKETNEIIDYLSSAMQLTPLYTNSRVEDENAPISERIQAPVENWLQAFNIAEFVVTDSFHACVFSILFRKPFIVYGNKERGMARFASLLMTFGLEERLVYSVEEANSISGKAIDWDRVHSTLEEFKAKSMEYLHANLHMS